MQTRPNATEAVDLVSVVQAPPRRRLLLPGTRRLIAADADTSDVALRALADKVNDEFALADQAWQTITLHAIACGTHLNELKARVVKRFGHGHWLEQREQYFPKRKRRTLEQYAQVAEWYATLAPAKAQRVALMTYRQVLLLLPGRTGERSSEHYTPSEYIEAARRVLGSIDLDPTSCAEANATVRATKYFTREQDGLLQMWHGKIWLNSPWLGAAGQFVDKLLEEVQVGHVSAAIVLLNRRSTDTNWFRPLWDCPLCFPFERLAFVGPGVHARAVSNVLAYLGPDLAAFVREFEQLGHVVSKHAARQRSATNAEETSS